jgi:hypothetical protein
MAMLLGVNTHQPPERELRLAASLGISFIRVDANWYDLEPEPERYTLEWLDNLMTTATELGVQVYPTIGYSPSWIGSRNTPPPIDMWRRFIRVFGERYQGKVQYVSFWNEPNILGMYAGTVDRYLHDVLQPAAETLKAIDPAYQICGPDLSTQGTWRTWLQPFLEHGRPWLDVLTVHAYGTPGRKVRDRLLEVRQVMDWAHAGDVPLALSEFGWNTAKISEAQQANYLDQFLEAVQSVDWLIAALYFNLINESTEVQWGLFRRDGTPKPGAEVMRRYTGQGVV